MASPFCDRDRALAAQLLKKMTLPQKIGQLNQLRGGLSTGTDTHKKFDPVVQIRAGRAGSILNQSDLALKRQWQRVAVEESPHGIPLLFAFDIIHGFKTIFPIPLAQSAGWDLRMIERAERIAAIEATANGFHWTFTPMLDVSREPRWGRVMEGSGEDAWLAGRIAEARIRGIQTDNLRNETAMLACAKHFAGYGAPEGGREYNTVSMGEADLREIYLPPFQAAVEAGAATCMAAFHSLNGIPCSCHRRLLSDILRDEWRFPGMVISDYNAIAELVNHGCAESEYDAAVAALNAGIDVDMMSLAFIDHLQRAVDEGRVRETAIDAAASRVLMCKSALGLFDNPYKNLQHEDPSKVFLSGDFLQFARECAAAGCVLLKNDNDVLPLDPHRGSVGIIGPLAATAERKTHMGEWAAWGSGDDVLTPAAAVKELVDSAVTVKEAPGGTITGECSPQQIAEAVSVAQSVDTVMLFLGEHGQMSGEARSRTCLGLPGNQLQLLEAVFAANPNTVSIIISGRPLVLSKVVSHTKALLQAWQGGTMAGGGIADVLFGRYNPAGKLTMSFPRATGQVPIYYDQLATGRPVPESDEAGVYLSAWNDCHHSPLFAFGYGLSYTRFAYGRVTLSAQTISAREKLEVRCSVTNTGSRAGHEVAQLYIRDHAGTRCRPLRRLRGFEKLFLQPGETAQLTFSLSADDLAYWIDAQTCAAEPGRFSVFVGGDSTTRNEAQFTLSA